MGHSAGKTFQVIDALYARLQAAFYPQVLPFLVDLSNSVMYDLW